MSWLPKQKVVVPVDFSDESFQAVETALDLVEDGGHLYVINVLPSLEPAEPGVIWNTVDNESRARHAEQALKERLSDAKYQDVNLEFRFGDPGHEIADYAAELGADLVVLPSHGRTGLKRLMIGSVAERVVRLCHCPVLVLRQ